MESACSSQVGEEEAQAREGKRTREARGGWMWAEIGSASLIRYDLDDPKTRVKDRVSWLRW